MEQPPLPLDQLDDHVDDTARSTADVVTCRPADSIATLATAIEAAKAGDRLAPVTVVVATNVAGVMARRALGRDAGILGVDVVTLGRVAELLAGPSLAAERREPVSNPVLEVTVSAILTAAPGMFAAVADHASTVTSLRRAHQELRLAGPAGRAAVARRSERGGEVARVSRMLEERLAERWYDEADVAARATALLEGGAPPTLRHLVVHLPQRLPPVDAAFARRLTSLVPTTVVAAVTGDAETDRSVHDALHDLGVDVGARRDGAAQTDATPAATPAAIVATTDADDEVRVAVRAVVDAARGSLTGTPVPFERIGVLWPTQVPYARLVEHHLEADGIPWNGRGGIAITERLAPRLLLDLLDVDRRRLRRSDLFDLVADVPPRDTDGRTRPTAEWHRLTRSFGISDDRDWDRLHHVDPESRWAGTARDLAAFVDDLRARLGRPDQSRTWRAWAQWCDEQLTHWLGPRAEIRLSDADYRAWEALMGCLDRLRSLDHVAPPATRRRFRAVLESELDEVTVREGRIGTGVIAGSLGSAPGLDLDVAIVLGGADGVMPPAPRTDPLLTEADRSIAGLPDADEHARRLHTAFAAVIDASHTVVTVPRGDLRSTTANTVTRWLEPVASLPITEVPSPFAGLEALASPPCERERRLRDRLRGGVPSDPDLVAASGDHVLTRAVAMWAGRAAPAFTEFDGDLTGVSVPVLGDHPISPTQLQAWAACPHAYFERYLLGVFPIEEVDREISIRPMESGSLQHRVLDRLHRDVIAGRLPQPADGWADEHRSALLTHFDAVCDETERRGRTGRPATWLGHRRRLRGELLDWLERDGALLRLHGAEIVSSEFEFGRAPRGDRAGEAWEPVELHRVDGRPIAVFGSADRVDRRRDGTLVVTDHKTGGDHYKQLGPDDPTLGGTVFQLPVYAAGAATLGLAAERVRVEYSMFATGGWARRGLDIDDDVNRRVSEALTHVVDGVEAGWFPLVPESPGWRLRNQCEHCDPDGIGTDTAWSRWHHKRHDPRAAAWFGDPPDDDGHDGSST